MFRLIAIFSISLTYLWFNQVQSADIDCSQVKCPSIPKHYEEFRCAPVKNEDECCPTYYDCSHLKTRDATKCYFGNKTYELREHLNDEETSGSCVANCVCRGHKDDPIPAKFLCSHIDCPEYFGSESDPSGEKCINIYDSESCCSKGKVCGKQLLELATCEHENRTYYEGQKIYPEGSCYSCICGKGFNNYSSYEENPNCEKINCNMDLHYQNKIEEGCIPVYLDDDNCCPIKWRCPDDETVIVPNKTKKVDESMQKCTFGNLTMNIGEVLSPESDETCTICECKVPPMAHCIQTC